MIALARNLQAALIASALLSPLPAQEYLRWLQDLGDEQKSEAAERALVAMGPKAIRPLGEQIYKWDTSNKRERARCIALLRVVSLLGEDAASLSSNLKQCGLEESCPLVPEIADTLATLEPYADNNTWYELFHQSISSIDNAKGRAMRAFVRMVSRQRVKKRHTFEALKIELAKDGFGAREVVAEALAKLGDKDAIDLLHQRLLNRDKQPKGADQLLHNGWVVPLEDEFGLRASNALIALAPSDSRAAVGYANRALHHPHRSVRLEALRQMAQLGPAASDAIPELMHIASQDDPAMALEALKLLGMAGKNVGKYLLAIDSLAITDKGPAARVAKGLAARLRAMGCEPTTVDVEAQTLEAKLARLDKALDESPDTALLEQIATTKGMWPRLSKRFRKGRAKTPDMVFELIARVGWLRREDERTKMRGCLALATGEHWHTSSMSSATGGSGMTNMHFTTHARLVVDPSSKPDELVKLMDDVNPFIREVVAQLLASRASDWAKGSTDYKAVHAVLLDAATAKHPKKFKIGQTNSFISTQTKQRTRQVQIAAAEALANCTVPNAKAVKLLKAVVQSTNEALVVKAIENWTLSGPEDKAVVAKLTDIATDKRESVANAAKAALARLEAK
ncbi:MAG: hypothetical protein ACI89X_003688 [Planctomycetota bacterium]|jgi:hypothetical protein